MALCLRDQRVACFAVSAGAFTSSDGSRNAVADPFGPRSPRWNVEHDNLRVGRVSSVVGFVCALDAERDRVVARRRMGAVRCYLRLHRGLGTVDQGELGRRRRGSVGGIGVDVANAKCKAEISRYAHQWSVPDYSPADLCRLCADAVDRANMDTGPAGTGTRPDLLLPRCAQAERTAVRGALW